MGFRVILSHSIGLNHDINVNKLREIIYVGITKQIMPRPSGDMAEVTAEVAEVTVHPRRSRGWTITPRVGHSAMSPSGQGIICILYNTMQAGRPIMT